MYLGMYSTETVWKLESWKVETTNHCHGAMGFDGREIDFYD